MQFWTRRLVAIAALAGILIAGERIVREVRRDKEHDELADRQPEIPDSELESTGEAFLQPARDDIAAHEDEVRTVLEHLASERPPDDRLLPDSSESKSLARDFLDAYRKHRWPIIAKYREATEDSEDQQRVAVGFLEDYLRAATSEDPSRRLRSLSSPLLEQDPETIDDPVIACHVAQILEERGDQETLVDKLLTRHVPNLTSQNSTPAFRARALIWQVLLAVRQQGDWKRHQKNAFQAIVESVESNPASTADRLHWRLIFPLSQAIPPEATLHLAGLIAQSDSASIYLAHLLAGWAYADLGWQARGADWATNVVDEQWEGLREYMEKAALHLHRAYVLHPEFPEAAHGLMSIAETGGETPLTFAGWFREALRAEFDYTLVYMKMRNGLRPRWGGSHRRLAMFAREAIDSGRWDTAIPYWSWQILTTIHEEVGEEHPFGTRREVADVAEHFATAVEKAVSDGLKMDHGFRREFMPTACAYMGSILIQARRYQQARLLFQFLEHPDQSSGFSQLKINRPYVLGLLAAMRDELAEDARVVHEELTSPPRENITDEWLAGLETRLQRLQATREDGRLGEDAAPFLEDITAMLDWQKAFARGDWVEPEFKSGMPGWYHEPENTSITDGHTVRLTSTSLSTGIQMRPLTEFNPPFVVEAQITLLSDQQKHYMAGVIVGPGDQRALYGREVARGLMAVNVTRNALLFRVERYGDQYEFPHWTFPSPGNTHSMRIYVWPGVVEYRIDGARIDVERDEEYQPSRILRFGQMYPKRVPADIAISSPRWRKLPDEPIPEKWDGIDQLAWYDKALEFDPSDAEALIRGAAILRHRNQMADARDRLDRAHALAPHHPALPWLRGIIAYNQGRHKDASGHFSQVAVHRERDYRGAAQLGAFIRAAAHEESLRDPEAAIRMVKPFLEKPGRSFWMSRMTMAAAHATLGDFDEAIKWHLKAAEDAPEHYSAKLKRELEDLRNAKAIRLKPTKGDVDFP